MIGAAIGLVIGLVMFFLGLTMLNLEKQNRKKEAEMAAATAQLQEEPVQTGEEQSTDVDEGQEDIPAQMGEEVARKVPDPRSIRRIKMGIQLLAQGILLLIVGIAFIFLHFYWKPIAEYITVPVVVVLAIIALVFDFYTMGASIEKEEKNAPVKNDESAQQVDYCTENSESSEQQTTQQEDDE